MPYEAKIICDSINPAGYRLTTMEITYPLLVHQDFLRHRQFSYSVESNRAIPINKMIDRVMNDPVIPIWWGKNQKGMSAAEEIENKEEALNTWLYARDSILDYTQQLSKQGLHKQIVNRLLHPFLWVHHIVTGIEPAYANFFALRCHKDAQPEIAKIAYMMKDLYLDNENNMPTSLEWGEWHLPYITEEEIIYNNNPPDSTKIDLPKVSAARCARVSYLTQDGKRDIEKDLELYDRLVGQVPRHASPLEHVAYACNEAANYVYSDYSLGCIKCNKSNFSGSGFHQLRKNLPDEYITIL